MSSNRETKSFYKPALLSPIHPVDNPFDHLIIDCVGPLPKSKFGSEYLLTVMCQVTHCPAVNPLHTITVKSVVHCHIWNTKGD